MKVQVNRIITAEAKTLHVEAGVRYWEDSEINGAEDDNENPKMPCIVNGVWCPIIDIDTGKILNWDVGVSADIHYKVCDSGCYRIKGGGGGVLFDLLHEYVPRMLCPKENGYGDYIIMDIDKQGFIKDWKADFSEFTDVE